MPINITIDRVANDESNHRVKVENIEHDESEGEASDASEGEAADATEDRRIYELESRIASLEVDLPLRNLLTSPEPNPVSKTTTEARIDFIDNRFDIRRGKRIDKEVEDFVDDDAPTCAKPIIVRRVFKDNNVSIDKTQIIIKSTGLRKLLQDVLSTYLKHEFKSVFEKKDITLPKPFIPLCFNWEELTAATSDSKILQTHGKENVDDLRRLLDLVYRLAPEYVGMRSNIKESKTVMKRHLHCLYKPGSLVVAIFRDRNAQLMKVHHFGAGSTAYKTDTASVFCEGYDWNGNKLERLRYEFPMPNMDTEEHFNVRDLPCYPVDMYEDKDGDDGVRRVEELKKDLIKRGQRFERFCNLQDEGGKKCRYKGQFQVEGDLRSGLLSNTSSRYVNVGLDPAALVDAKEVVIDFQSFLEYGPTVARNGSYIPQTDATPCSCSLCISQETKEWIANFGLSREQKESENYALLPHRALGFALGSKLWGQFSIDGIELDTNEMDQVFEQELVFPGGKNDKKKRVVKDLVMNHGNQSFSRITDFVGGKGQGLVLLFHGPPGVGKTMTAETLAKSCGKIMLSVGIGDLGTTAEMVERSLHKLFEVVTAWRGILLIDEADIFLDSRGSKGDVFPEQNAMVSVMLRLLEYFSGVLIMTTNRVKSIDYAIMSRISYAIKFQALSIEHQKLIYQDFLEQARKKISIKDTEREKMTSLTKRFKPKENLNGRDIRTMFTTAQLLGNGELKADDMEEIYEQQTSFKDDMNNLYILAENAAVIK